MSSDTIFPKHILLKIFSFLNQEDNFTKIFQRDNSYSFNPIYNKLFLVSEYWGKLYWNKFCENQCYCIFLFRFGIYPFYKKSFDTPNQVLDYLVERDRIDKKNQVLPSPYPMDFYFILRLKKEPKNIESLDLHGSSNFSEFQNELILFLETETIDFNFDLINDIKDLESNNPNKRQFNFRGQTYYFLDIYQDPI